MTAVITDSLLSPLVEIMSEGLILLDSCHRCRYANPAGCALLRIARHNLLGQDLSALFSPPERPAIAEQLSPGAVGRPAGWSSIFRDEDGGERAIEYASQLCILNGEPLVAVSLRDVTEIRQLRRASSAVAKIAASVTYDGTVEETLEGLARSVVQATGIHACTLILLDETHGSSAATVASIYGMPDDLVARLQAIWQSGAGSPLSLRALQAGETTVIPDIPQTLLANPAYEPIHDYLRVAPWSTVVSVPLLYHGRPLGVLAGHYSRDRSPGEAEIAFLNIIADQTAIVLENARLAAEAQELAALEERQKLARELHDSVSQALFGIGLGARTARVLIERDPAQAIPSIDYVLSLAHAGMAEMRALILELRPESLEIEGVVKALEKQAEATSARYEIAIHPILCEEPDVPLPVKEAVYRIAQEAIHNVVKHAQATNVQVLLSCNDDEVALEIQDDGRGFDPNASFPGHLGQHSMRERAARLSGAVEIESATGQGTRIRARLPRTASIAPPRASMS